MYPRTRLPGVYLDTVNPPAPQGLPRMDVAVFAGMAAAGPCHRAVLVDSVAAYEAVFGGDLPLAFDTARGETLHANLAPAVRAFFSNGGTQCWVVRLAMTPDHADAWRKVGGRTIPPRLQARSNHFAMAGLLARYPGDGDEGLSNHPALLVSRSVGAWSDDQMLAARLLRETLGADGLKMNGTSGRVLTMIDTGVLRPGDLIEIVARTGALIQYAGVVRATGGLVWLNRIAGFAPLRSPVSGQIVRGTGIEPGKSFVARFAVNRDARIEANRRLSRHALQPGRWVSFRHDDRTCWFQVDRVEHLAKVSRDIAFGRAWHESDATTLGKDVVVSRVTLEMATIRGNERDFTSGIGLCLHHDSAIHAMVDDDHFYAPYDRRTATRRPAFALTRGERARLTREDGGDRDGFGMIPDASPTVALGCAWLPLGLDAEFGAPAPALHDEERPLARNGLSVLDNQLYLDPRLATLSTAALAGQAEQLRDLQETQLFGIHAVLDIPADLYSPASILAVPDAALPGLDYRSGPNFPVPAETGAGVPAHWLNHAGPCLDPASESALLAPDLSRFLDVTTALLAAPVLTHAPERTQSGRFTFRWEAPEGAVGEIGYELEQSARSDFAGAGQVGQFESMSRGLSFPVSGLTEGAHYFRLRARQGENVSRWVTHLVVMRIADDLTTKADVERVLAVHVAMMRMAAGSSDLFALLSLPRDFRADQASAYARKLAGRTSGLGSDELRALSWGAVYHPWLVSAGAGGLVTVPDGAIAGTYARRATQRGAWIAPANEVLRDISGLDPLMRDGDMLALDQSCVNTVRRLPAGFAVLDSDTLSPETDWTQINVRRLMMLIRRAAMQRGYIYVFEPNGAVVRRAVERSMVEMLDDLQLRGAFAGRTSSDSWRIALPEAANDREQGRLVVEIAVSPAWPMRFLTLRMAQQGARLSIAEAA